MKHENENPLLSIGGEIETPKGVSSPPYRECEKSQSRTDAAKRTLSALKKRVRFTPEVETPKDELRESNRPGAIPGIKYDFVRFKNHPAFDEYGNYIGKNKIIGE